jgi:hypothetical protein
MKDTQPSPSVIMGQLLSKSPVTTRSKFVDEGDEREGKKSPPPPRSRGRHMPPTSPACQAMDRRAAAAMRAAAGAGATCAASSGRQLSGSLASLPDVAARTGTDRHPKLPPSPPRRSTVARLLLGRGRSGESPRCALCFWVASLGSQTQFYMSSLREP